MKFFLPDWDDRVDPGYDFATDRFTLVRDPYRDDMYAHELFDERPYDGVLVSRMALGESGPKRSTANQIGMRKYLRLPADVELLGDCGAFGYVSEKEPRFETGELIKYYDKLDFDYGVSIDHVIVPEFHEQRNHRYEVTLRNAEEFLEAHSGGKHRFTPIGAVQGWDPQSYVEAAQALTGMGYDYIALGGLARSNTQTIREIVLVVKNALPAHVRVHVFGVARLTLLPLFLELGIESVDSAAPLRQAWLSAHDNYYTIDRTYAAIRIPVVDEERPKTQTLVGRSPSDLKSLKAAEKLALESVRAYDRGKKRLASTLEEVMAYDDLLANRCDGQTTARRRLLYTKTLEDKPWKHCDCKVCHELGIEVIIFRGNNRNRRRGFHNLWQIQQRIHKFKKPAGYGLRAIPFK